MEIKEQWKLKSKFKLTMNVPDKEIQYHYIKDDEENINKKTEFDFDCVKSKFLSSADRGKISLATKRNTFTASRRRNKCLKPTNIDDLIEQNKSNVTVAVEQNKCPVFDESSKSDNDKIEAQNFVNIFEENISKGLDSPVEARDIDFFQINVFPVIHIYNFQHIPNFYQY